MDVLVGKLSVRCAELCTVEGVVGDHLLCTDRHDELGVYELIRPSCNSLLPHFTTIVKGSINTLISYFMTFYGTLTYDFLQIFTVLCLAVNLELLHTHLVYILLAY
jgi:hypothetical protein